MQYFTKITTDEHNDLFRNYLLTDDLALRVLILITMRVRSSDSKVLNLNKGEFLLSETEYKLFGLKKSQSGRLRRTLLKLVSLGIVQKTENKTENQATVYRLIDNDFADCSREKQRTKQRTNREPIENKQRGTKNDKNIKSEKNDKYKDAYASYVNVLNSTFNKNYTTSTSNNVGKKRYKMFRERLKDGYTSEQFKVVFDNISKDPHHRDSNYKWVTPEFICRPDKFERFLNT